MEEQATMTGVDECGRPDRPQRGRWIALEGPDGGGKTSQIPCLVSRLQAAGIEVVTTKEPGGVATFGTALREYLFTENRIEGMSPEAQLLFFQADRAATVRDVIMPALAAGKWVVCDRGPFGSTVYQGIVQGVDVDDVAKLTDWATGGTYPDLTLILDVSPEIAQSRLAAREGATNWFDRWDFAHLARVRNAYSRVARAAAERCSVIAADASHEAVEEAIWDVVTTRLALGRDEAAYSSAHFGGGNPSSSRSSGRPR
jgi:dTMP kinase